MSAKIDVMKTWLERVWANEDEATIDEMLVGDTMARGLGSENRKGPEEFKAFHRAMLGLIGNVEFIINQNMEDGDWLSCLVTVKGTQRKKEGTIEITGQIWAKIVDGKILDAYNHFDFMGLFEQCDLLPQKSFESCLSCEKIG
jgi:hypothetical protein